MHHSHRIYMYLHILFFAPFVYAYSELMIIFFYLGPNSPFWWMRECVEKLVPDASSPDRSKVFFTHLRQFILGFISKLDTVIVFIYYGHIINDKDNNKT